MNFKHNYHTHTARCNHASGADREYVEAAISAGLKSLGFSDHAPIIGYPNGFESWFRMKPEETALYMESIRSLKEEYDSSIKIHCGFELEYYPQLFDATIDFLRPMKPDYFILGQHFIHNEYDGVYAAASTRVEEFLIYCDQVCEAMKTGRYTYLAHPDLIIAPDDRETYLLGMDKVCKCAKAEGMPLEYNLLGLSGGRAYPTKRFFELAAENGCDVILGLDAHSPEAFKCEKWAESAEEFLKSIGITPLGEIELRCPVK